MTTQDSAHTSTAKAQTAPSPEDSRKPDSPNDLVKPTWMYIAKRTLREFSKDQCPDAAAGLTYYAVLSLFPALLALVSLIGIFGDAGKTTSSLLDIAQQFAPGPGVDAMRQPIEELTQSNTAGFALVFGILVALWSASGYVTAFSRAMNRVYEVDEGRGFIKLRGTMLAVTIVAVVGAALAAAMLVLSGPVAEAIGGAIGLSETFLTVWNIAKWPVLIVVVVAIIAVLYYFTPNVKQPKFRWMSMGSLIALVIFALASLGFGFYVANFSNYNKTYGALAGVIIMLLWLWILNMSLLFGAEFDAEMERGRQLQGGIEAEKSIQLPPRDTKKSDKMQEKEDQVIRDGEEIRETHGDEPQQTDGGDRRRGR
ncbi:YihY/virulence factor BrkB family protein [Paenarthrobacter sp. YAF11_1]|uniref:YihY/virulence factor BrkB family protein n=1 Tax=Micrococcaceae TaxID=1268 RepID=UPI0028833BF9|nr:MULTISPECIES: YihY/virulence factor BrkB family protein [unclassified Arthrobacter]